jgi:translocation and assembly module TamB
MVMLVDKATKMFDISYKSLDGNLLKNITLQDISYKDKKLAQKAHIDINFNALLHADLKVDDITLEGVDLKILEQMIADQNRKKKKKKKLQNIPTISISSLFFSTTPYHEHDLNIENLKFIANDIKGDLTNLDIGSFSFYTQSQQTNITADGTLKNKVLDLNHLWITDIDIEKIVEFYNKQLKKAKDTNQSKKEDKKPTQTMIKEIKINNFKTDIKAYDYKKYKIQNLSIKADQIYSDLKSIKAKTSIEAVTNMWKLKSKGALKDNKLLTDVKVILNDKYFKKFVPFFDHDKIKPIKVDLELDKDGLAAKVYLKTDNLLTGKVKDLNLSVKQAVGVANLSFKPIDLKVRIDGNLSAKHSKNIALVSNLYYDKEHKFTYDGTLFTKKLRNLDTNITELMRDTKVAFYGNTKNIQAHLSNKNLTADYNSTIYKKGLLSIDTNEIELNQYLTNLPKELQALKAKAEAKIPIDFKDLNKFDADVKLDTNALNLRGKITYKDGFNFDTTALPIQNSILKNYDKNIKLKGILPLKIKSTWRGIEIQNNLKQKKFALDLNYNTKTKELNSSINLALSKLSLSGKTDERLKLKASTLSLKTLQEDAQDFYNFKKQPLDGEVVVDGFIDANTGLEVDVKSKWLVYEYTPNKFAFAEKVKLKLHKKENTYKLKNYYFSTYLDYDREFFSNKNSTFTFKNSIINLQNLWVNDQATVKGEYNIKKGSGVLNTYANSYHYKGKEGDVFARINVATHLNKDYIKLEGDVKVQKATITYEAKKDYYIQDDDIIIIQEERAKKEAKQNSTLIVDVAVISTKHIRYKVKDTDVKLDIDLKLWKEKAKELELLGMVKLIEGKHTEANKEFKVDSGEILFAGAILNPYLNINVSHFNDPYDIDININGLLDSPNINFTSTPYLTQSDILSLLLFDATTEDLFSSNGDSSKAAISMFGNTFAKELVENFGIKLDKLVLSTTEDGGLGIEVGKKISKKTTILYINDIVQTIKIKYQNSRRFETDITLSPDTSGIDFLYKNEY